MSSEKPKMVDALAQKAVNSIKKEIPTKERQLKIHQEFTDVKKMKEETIHFLSNFSSGFLACFKGIAQAAMSPKVRASHIKYGKYLLGACGIMFLVTQLTVLPFRIILGIISLFITMPDSATDWMDTFVSTAIFIVPFLMVMGARNINPKPFENLFFDCLDSVDPAYGAYLKATPHWSAQQGRTKATKRLWKMVKMAVIFKILSAIPYVNLISVPLADYLAFNQRFGIKLSALFFTLMAVGLKHQVSWFVGIWIAARVLGLEILEPFLSRNQFPEGSQHQILKKYDPLIIGFSFPLMILVNLNYVGPLFFGMAFAAAPLLALQLREIGLAVAAKKE